VGAFVAETNRLRNGGFLLLDDVRAVVADAA
jgi:hypothetical protein